MNRIVGTCSLCSGPVTAPDAWMGLTPPIPTCSYCGARKKQEHGPVIEMTHPRKGFLPPRWAAEYAPNTGGVTCPVARPAELWNEARF